MIVSKHYLDQNVRDTPLSDNMGEQIPELRSWMPKGIIRFGGKNFDCREAGCYRFWNQSETTIHTRLVHAYPGGVEPDLYGFLSGMSWHHAHDITDHDITMESLAKAGHNHVWRLKCGVIANLARWFLTKKYGYQTRQVNLLTNEPRLGAMNGHIVFEVLHENKWKLWDLTNGVYFRKDDQHLSAAEIISEGVLNCTRVRIDGSEKRAASFENGWCSKSARDLMILLDSGDWLFNRVYQKHTITE